jgi:hypothetical protein
MWQPNGSKLPTYIFIYGHLQICALDLTNCKRQLREAASISLPQFSSRRLCWAELFVSAKLGLSDQNFQRNRFFFGICGYYYFTLCPQSCNKTDVLCVLQHNLGIFCIPKNERNYTFKLGHISSWRLLHLYLILETMSKKTLSTVCIFS